MQTTPETEVPQGMTEEQGAQELLKRWGATEEAPQAEPETEGAEESEDQPQSEDDAVEDADDSAEADSEVEIDVGGEKFKVSPTFAEQAKRIEAKVKEIEAGSTKRFQEAADLRKAAEAQIEAAKQLQKVSTEQADLIADHKLVTRRLQALEKMDVNALAETDPVQLTRINAEYMQLTSAKQRIEQSYQEALQKSQTVKTQLDTARIEQLQNFAQKNIKGWSEEYSVTLMDFAVKELGMDADALRASVNEAVIKGLDLAYKGWKVQSTDPKAKMVQTSKTLKPSGNAGVKTNATVQAEKAKQRLAKTGRVEDAVALLLSRSKRR